MVRAYFERLRGMSSETQKVTCRFDNRLCHTSTHMRTTSSCTSATASVTNNIHIQGSQPRMYHSLQEYLQIMSLPSAYAGYIEIAAAQQLYGLNIVVVIAGNAFPAPPQQPPQHTLHVLFHPHSLHYSTLRPVIGQTPSP